MTPYMKYQRVNLKQLGGGHLEKYLFFVVFSPLSRLGKEQKNGIQNHSP
jgi:hypothetical protein